MRNSKMCSWSLKSWACENVLGKTLVLFLFVLARHTWGTGRASRTSPGMVAVVGGSPWVLESMGQQSNKCCHRHWQHQSFLKGLMHGLRHNPSYKYISKWPQKQSTKASVAFVPIFPPPLLVGSWSGLLALVLILLLLVLPAPAQAPEKEHL